MNSRTKKHNKIDLARLLAETRMKKRSESPSEAGLPIPSSQETTSPIPSSIQAKLEALKKQNVESLPQKSIPSGESATGMHGEAITYNSEQQHFIDLASSGANCVLIGAAGSGKTTCTQGAISKLISSGRIPILDHEGHMHLSSGTPGIITIAYTRRAVNNIKKVLPEDLKPNCITAHKLLEYMPVYDEVWDEENGKYKKTMQFLPSRNASNPLPSSIHTIVVEESSMLSLDLYAQIIDALSHSVQWIFIGDIQQLPPVFGPAILGYKMLEYQVIELTHIYRQALESPIIALAHKILSGKPIVGSTYPDYKREGQLTLHPWKKKLTAEHGLLTAAAFLKQAYDSSIYNPEEDMILIPYNKSFGTEELNKHLANHIAKKYQRETYEVIAGFNKHYYSVSDRVLYDKEDAEILTIEPNPAYGGVRYQAESATLDYWGHNPNFAEDNSKSRVGFHGLDTDDEDIDALLEAVAISDDDEDRTTAASHRITLRLIDSDSSITIDRSAEINKLLHSYALTVHKAQGSEWNKVFLLFHHSHATMLQRELLYTAVTRARKELYVICEKETFTKGIISQRIKGDTLEEKAEFFKGKISEKERDLLGYTRRH